MDNDKLILVATYVISGVVLVLICIPMILRKIKPNPWYGFRVPKTLKNPDIWYDVNAYAGRLLLVAGVVTTLVPLALYFVPNLSFELYLWLTLAVVVVSIFGATILSFIYLARR